MVIVDISKFNLINGRPDADQYAIYDDNGNLVATTNSPEEYA